ncbi:DUF7341 domain-containing protein [Arthrobacter russicus]|uniref:DUF7341 domain-containing protein n=1 Tax=Arthrobacter russicus TaxID=172040 RepID=A0ABU1JDU5_9MICC|nr:hypothetical protein [Arthrobacter russicus]MDR6270609.1 hypothetical protein [Arthrobacter russicus]
MDLSQAVHELTRPHKTTITRDSGAREYVSEDSLLDQLRGEISSSGNRSGVGANRYKVPLALDVLDLYQSIARTAQDLKAAEAPHAKTTGTIESIIQAWAAATTRNEAAERIVSKWCEQIHALINPPKKIEINAPCPQCGNRHTMNEAGDINLALVATNGVVRCSACLTEWTGAQLWNLRDAISYSHAS